MNTSTNNKMKQKDAVYQAIEGLFEIVEGAAVALDKESRGQVVEILCAGFESGKISYEGEIPVGAKLRTYSNGLLSNWLTKDSRLNGGVKYVAKNPGSRTGNGDPIVKAMRTLLATKTDETERAEIQEFIDKRIAEIKPVSVKSTVKTLTAEQIEALKAIGLGYMIS